MEKNSHSINKLKNNSKTESECKKTVDSEKENQLKLENNRKTTKNLIKDCVKDWCESTTSHGIQDMLDNDE
jgi:hypothetical protein